MVRIRTAVIVAVMLVASGVASAGNARAQEAARAAPGENIMKVCGDKWRAVREAEAPKGVTWPQFLSRCRAGQAAARGSAGGASAASSAGAPKSKDQVKAPVTSVAAPVFPSAVSARHASERPALARQRTCADQFKANKATGGNAGLKWIERGGGYWSRCNAHLKQARA